jgi:type I restriction enzyme M protein
MAQRITSQQLESYLWGAAVLLRGTIDAGDYKQFIFPLLFYKRLCDVFDEETQAALAESDGDQQFSLFPENHRFQIPLEAHWRRVRQTARDVGRALQNALRAIEIANPDKLYGIFGDAQWTNKDRLSDAMLRDLVEHFSALELSITNLPEDELGQGYEYLIKKFADDSGHTAAEFYTNRTVVHLMTEILQPQPGESIYDPTCGSGGMLLSAIAHLRRQGQEWRNVRLYGQERNLMTSAIARMNCFLHGIEDFRIERGDTLTVPKLVQGDRLMRFDVVLANPPYSIKQWDRDTFASDSWGRNLYGTPPQGRADYAFWQHILQSLAPRTGRCAILFPHGVLFRQEEAAMRRKLIEADVIECVLGLGPNLFYNSAMEACVVICRTAKAQKGKILFLNAVNEVTRERTQSFLTDDHIERIVSAYQSFKDEGGFAKLASLEEVRANDHSLKIDLYVPTPAAMDSMKSGTNSDLLAALGAWTESRVQMRDALSSMLADGKLLRVTESQPNLQAAAELLRRFDRSKWVRVRFGDVVRMLKEQVDPLSGEVERYIAGEHMDSDDVHIRRWGTVGDGYLGPAFIRRFRKEQVLYGSRRTYLKKVAMAEFDGVTANTTFVLEAVQGKLLQELLPWLMLSERFTQHSIRESKGLTNPYINFPDIAKFEFALPPLDQQRRIAEILWALDEVVCKWRDTSVATEEHARSTSDGIFEEHQNERHLVAPEACDQITVGIVVKPASYYTDAEVGIPALRSVNVFLGRFELSNLGHLTPKGHQKNLKSQLKKGDVVVVRTARPGDAAVVTDRIAGMNLIDLILVRPKPLLLPEYLVEFLNSAFGRRQISRGSAGTAQQHFNVSEFQRLEMPAPSITEQRKAVDELASLKVRLQLCQGHTSRVTTLQTALLEVLLS